jgi:hypothetical protein
VITRSSSQRLVRVVAIRHPHTRNQPAFAHGRPAEHVPIICILLQADKFFCGQVQHIRSCTKRELDIKPMFSSHRVDPTNQPASGIQSQDALFMDLPSLCIKPRCQESRPRSPIWSSHVRFLYCWRRGCSATMNAWRHTSLQANCILS